MNTEATADRLPIGTRVEILGRIGGDARAGDLGTILGDCPIISGSYKVKIDGKDGGWYENGVYTVEPRELRPLRETVGEVAELELAEFKKLVRDKVIEEADRQGWCRRVDGWLEELGLEPRWCYLEDGPRETGTILNLGEGEGFAVLALPPGGDTPWVRLMGDAAHSAHAAEWLSFEDLNRFPKSRVVLSGTGRTHD